MTQEVPPLPFSQRTGLVALPPQLKLGEVSPELRRLLWYAVHTDLSTCVKAGGTYRWVENRWKAKLLDMHVRVFGGMPDTFTTNAGDHERKLREMFERAPLEELFDFVEFILRRDSSLQLASDLASAFVDARAAYRILDKKTITAVGTDDQGKAVVAAVEATIASGFLGARAHLLAAGKALRDNDWPGSIRESIHAVEAVVVSLAPDKATLGSALSELEKKGHVHGALKTAFGALYGYTSDEAGVRHALVFSNEANVDEADALFMLGACSSFVSFLIARST